MEAILDWFTSFPAGWAVVLSSVLPVIELRGAIPLGLGMGLGLWESFILAFIGSCLPVPILVFFFKPIMAWLRKTKLFRRFAEWLQRRTERHSSKVKVRKYTLLGLFIFVAIPIPTTGVWTGSMIASFLDIRAKHAIPVIMAGNLAAGIIVLAVSYSIF
jgi:uncharacterized membrane protein